MHGIVYKGTNALAPLPLTMTYDLLVIKRLGVEYSVPSCVSRVLGLNMTQSRVLKVADGHDKFQPALTLWWGRISKL